MLRYVCLASLALFAGCSLEGPHPEADALPLSAAAVRAQPHHAMTGFASLPDRGDLVGYPRKHVIRHDGAYTWHRADISEEHALRAIADGSLRITTPSGEILDFRYERHVEHPSGDWTWVGRGASSDEAIVTFGDRAAFGTIGQPGRAPLKLTIRSGVAWLVETDLAKIALIDNSATRPQAPDYFVPPKLVAADSVSSTPSSAETFGPVSAAAAASATVDVLLGYTNGFAAALGGQSQAVTRLNNMVEVANQVNVNSLVDARMRLVHAMQVNYPDNTPNGSTLEALTGFSAPSTLTQPDPAFAALRAARDEYGADLVSLVRKFNTPENDGCGIAWLIGGGRTGINSDDEYFGYSVVSDGQDADTDGKNYFCREETLAHEMGHNMGSQHDRVTASESGTLKYGAYDYSFGYKTASGTGNFYTVMAYGDRGQTSYRTFSNPATTFCGGVACGTSNQADNARSLRQTTPMVAGFRNATIVQATFDLNQDGRSDLLWHNQGSSRFAYWLMLGSKSTYQSPSSATPPGFLPRATGDFNADGYWDVLWSNGAEMRMRLASANGGASWVSLGSQPSGWKVVGAEDLDGDGRADLLWHNPGSSRFAYWLMSGDSVLYQSPSIVLAGGFVMAASGDLNGDGYGDMVWSNGLSLSVRLGTGGGNGAWYSMGNQPTGWKVAGLGDINRDGRADMLWHDAQSNRFAYWLMNGTTVMFKSASTSLATGFVVVAGGDYNGDGYWDMLWSNGQTLSMRLAGVNGAATWASVGSHPAGWKPIGP